MSQSNVGQTVLVVGGVAVGGYLLLRLLSGSTASAATSSSSALSKQLAALSAQLKQSMSKASGSPASKSGGPTGSLRAPTSSSGPGLLAQLAALVGIGNSETSLLSTQSDNTSSLLPDNPLSGFSWGGFDNLSWAGIDSTGQTVADLIPYSSVTAFVDQLPTYDVNTWNAGSSSYSDPNNAGFDPYASEWQNAALGDYGASGSDLSNYDFGGVYA